MDPVKSIFKNIEVLRKQYPDDDEIAMIDRDFTVARNLVAHKDWAEHDVTKELISIARAEILVAKKKLATDRTLVGKPDVQKELWFVIEKWEWFLSIASKDYLKELETLNNELERMLQ